MTTHRYVLGTLLLASVSLTVAQAATFGHSRIVSAPGQPLHLEIPVSQLTQQEIDSLRAVPAPAQAWREAGMTPPVALDSMRLVLLDGLRSDTKVIQLRSDQASSQPIVDVLLDVRSASGQQRYQVSLLAQLDTHAVQRAGGEGARNPRAIDGRGATAAQPGSHAGAGRQIQVRPGDNMFAVAGRNAVQGVTVYQMMIALQRANPQAFIEDNVNLVKAGASLTMPDMAALTALSDREARRIFQQHAQAFARYRQRGGSADAAALSTIGSAAQGGVSEAPSASTASGAPEASSSSGDLLRLSGAPAQGAAAGGPASALATGGGAAAAGSQPATAGQGASQNQSGNGNGGMAASAAAGGIAANASPASGNGTQLAGTGAGPAVNMLASSGAIASDAVVDTPSGAAGSGANTANSGQASGAAATATAPAGGTASTHPDDQAAMQKGVEESRTRILELEDNVRHLNEALQKTGPTAAEAALEGARSVSEAIKEAMGIVDDEAEGSSAGDTAAGTSQPTVGQVAGSASSGSATSSSGSASSSSGSLAQQGAATSSSSSVKAEQKVSWLQENMLAVIGGGLALIVLIVAWLLRRASAAKRDIFDSDSPITDSMVRDKLAEIDLDLDSPAQGGAGRRSS